MVLSSRIPVIHPLAAVWRLDWGGQGVGSGKKQGGSEEAAADSLDESGISPALAALSVPLLDMCTCRSLVT